MRRFSLIFVFFAAVALCYGQTNTGTILGTVKDSNGYLVPGAKITIQNQGTGLMQNLTSDLGGSFISTPLPLGNYKVTVATSGFEAEVKEGLTLQVSDRLQLPFVLHPGDVKQTVVVSQQAPLVDAASTTLGGIVSKQQVADLPINGRSVTDLLALVPGVELRGNSNQLSVGGQGTDTNEGGLHFLLDGGDASRVDFDDVGNTYGSSAGRVSRASVDAVEEFRVYTDSYSAEYGKTQGGVVNLITKSGTNQLHGSLFEYFRNDIFDARDYFNQEPNKKPAYRLNQFGGTLGGPIVHDKIFFFVDYEGVRQRSGSILNAVVPTAEARAAAVPVIQQALSQLPLPNGPISSSDPRFGQYIIGISNPLTENTGIGKIDWQITPSDRLTGRYNVNQNQTDTFTGVAIGQVQSAPGFMQLGMLGYTHTFTPHVVNEANFYFNRFHVDPRASNVASVLVEPIISFGEGAGVGPGLFDLHVANNSFTWQDNLTWVRGRQQIKIGGEAVRNQDNKELGYQMTVSFLTFSAAQQNQAFSDGTLGFPRIGIRNTYYSAFLQDNIQVSPKLTLNMGLRYQYDTSPTEAHNRIANFNFETGALDPVGGSVLDAPNLNFAPRFGVAYSIGSSGNTVIRGGFGLFFSDLNAGNLAQNIPSNTGLGFSASVNNLQVPGLVGLPFPNLGSFSLPTTSFSAIVKNYQEPYSEKWNLNFQQAIGKSAMVQFGYIGARGLHLIEGYDANRLFPGGASRPYPQYGSINTNTTSAISSYNAFQAQFKKRWDNGLTFNANYTLSHSLDDAPTVFGSYQDDHNPIADYGNSDFDVRHNIELDASYAIPAASRVPKIIGAGWQYNTIATLRSGFPYDVTCGCDPLNVGQASSRADLVAGVPTKPSSFSIPFNQLNLAAFATPVGHFGTEGRNIFYGPDAVNFDMSLFKTFKVFEKQQVIFRAEAFNIFNHPQFSNPNAGLNNVPQFGQTTNTISTLEGFHTSRQFQFALRYSF
ncbi:TonB-dependent receptor [Granulicella sp. S190]|uniref:TonB-dependent receptor n=1 Tax=Granulicella sp. S190 TaxID=1747226 RepID=UPI00131BBCA1|nr:TonB-dependent receptor [Granulicella sp. S190]